MAIVSMTRNIIEGFVREGSFKWLIKSRTSFAEDFEEMENSPSAGRNWIPELSPVANVIVRRCTKILEVSSSELRENFDAEASDSIKQPSCYARNFLEYCCFRALALSTQVVGYLEDQNFCRLTFDMMLAWEFPAVSSQPFLSVDEDVTVGVEAFSRIAPAVPIIANVITSDNLFEVLTASSGARLQFSVYDKYLTGLERAIRKFKVQSESSLLSTLRLDRGEKILEVDGTVTTQPVLQHIGISAWPGRLILTDYTLYFEAHRVVSYDKATKYDLSEDLKQVVKPDLTGPWGTRLFDKAVFYKSISLSEPVIMEFPELKGHTRRDYWLAIIREILHAHRFVQKFQITGIEREEVLLKATLGILRIQALKEISLANPILHESLLVFNLCDQLPGGDLVLEALANMSSLRGVDRTNSSHTGNGMYSISARAMASNLGFVFGSGSNANETGLCVGEISVGEMTPLEIAVKESRTNHQKVVFAKATVDGVKVDGIDTNLAVMQELLYPIKEVGKWLLSLLYWEDSFKSSVFCLVAAYIIFRGWVGYAFALFLISVAIFMVVSHFFSQDVEELKVEAPPPMSAVEQLLAVQNVISQSEVFIQDGNIVLLKIRGLLLAIFPQASEKFAFVLVVTALMIAFLPSKYLILFTFLNIFTQYSPLRRVGTERFERRLREWWFSIPAAPVVLERTKEDKKRR